MTRFMCRLFESIRLEHGELQQLKLHEARMQRSRKELWNLTDPIRLGEIVIPGDFKRGIFKCRIIYKDSIESVEFLPYGIRKLKSLKLVTADTLEYNHKYLDRTPIQEILLQNIDYDDVVIVKNGFVTDSSYSNLAFFDGRRWITPASPLLHGIRRQYLLDHDMIVEMDIRPENLGNFSEVSFINAMMDLGELIFPVSDIVVV